LIANQLSQFQFDELGKPWDAYQTVTEAIDQCNEARYFKLQKGVKSDESVTVYWLNCLKSKQDEYRKRH